MPMPNTFGLMTNADSSFEEGKMACFAIFLSKAGVMNDPAESCRTNPNADL